MPVHIRVPLGDPESAYVDIPAVFVDQLKTGRLEELQPFTPLEAINVLNLVLE